jgi:guanylate kinase
MTSRRGLLFVLSGPSGCGKTSLARALLARHSDPAAKLTRSVSVTTRPPRPGEQYGADYLFVTEAQFTAHAAAGAFLEQTDLYGYRYATPHAFVEGRLGQGVDVLLVLDPAGRRQLAATQAADLVSVYLLPPDHQELERRLRSRSQDGEDSVARRLAAAHEEIACCKEYDHVLVNRQFAQTLEALDAILQAARRSCECRPSLPAPADTITINPPDLAE